MSSDAVILAPPHLALSTPTPSLLFPSHGDLPCDPRPGAQSGRVAEKTKAALQVFEPNDLTEVNCSEVTLYP